MHNNPMNTGQRLEHEREHGRFIAQKGEEIWNWSSPAGIIRWQRRAEMFRGFLGNEERRVLELGCGTGLFTQELSRTDNEIIAIDISPDLIALAQERVHSPRVVFRVENAYCTNFPEGSFDFIVGSSVLHHLDVDAAIREFFRLLKTGGKIMFTEPNMMNPQIALQKNIPVLKRWAGDSPDETAFFRWSLRKKLESLGLRDVTVTPFDFLHPLIPARLIPIINPALGFIERIPLLREIAGSLVIKGTRK